MKKIENNIDLTLREKLAHDYLCAIIGGRSGSYTDFEYKNKTIPFIFELADLFIKYSNNDGKNITKI